MLEIDSSIVDVKTVAEWIAVAGRLRGVGDWRPRFGRFTVTSWRIVAVEDTGLKQAA
jgi:hypothetical protein